MKFVFLRDRVVASTSGHTIGFQKGVPQYVPPEARKDVYAAGGMPEDEAFNPDEDADKNKQLEVTEPVDPAEREAAVFAAFEKLVLGGKREDFTANGLPSNKALKAALGWDLPVRDRDLFWQQFQQKGAGK